MCCFAILLNLVMTHYIVVSLLNYNQFRQQHLFLLELKSVSNSLLYMIAYNHFLYGTLLFSSETNFILCYAYPLHPFTYDCNDV